MQTEASGPGIRDQGAEIAAVERRRARRHVPDPLAPIARVRLRTGRELAVIDLSPLGVLVEGATRLLPGTHLDVHVTSAQGRIPVRARVVRCHVWSLTSEAVQYRGAFAFGALVEFSLPGSTEQLTSSAV